MPDEPELVPPRASRTRSWRSSYTASYEGYVVPFVVHENAVRYLTESYDLDRDASRIALRDGSRSGSPTSGCAGRTPGSAASASFPPNAGEAPVGR